MPNRGLARAGPATDTAAGTLQPRGPGWQLDPVGNSGARGMVIQGGNPRTESGLQAIRASQTCRGGNRHWDRSGRISGNAMCAKRHERVGAGSYRHETDRAFRNWSGIGVGKRPRACAQGEFPAVSPFVIPGLRCMLLVGFGNTACEYSKALASFLLMADVPGASLRTHKGSASACFAPGQTNSNRSASRSTSTPPNPESRIVVPSAPKSSR